MAHHFPLLSSTLACPYLVNVFTQVVGSLVPLGLICLVVTLGNLLVISAVRMEKVMMMIMTLTMPCHQVKISSKLSGPTYTIIVSLAVADLLLGLLVLPLSAVYEVSLYILSD